jgi:flagellar hook-length control protein FliK
MADYWNMIPSAVKNLLPPTPPQQPARQAAVLQREAPPDTFRRELIRQRKEPQRPDDSAPVRLEQKKATRGAKSKKTDKPQRAEEDAPTPEARKSSGPAKAGRAKEAAEVAPQDDVTRPEDEVDAAAVAADENDQGEVNPEAAGALVAGRPDASAGSSAAVTEEDGEAADGTGAVAGASRGPVVSEAGADEAELDQLAALLGEGDDAAPSATVAPAAANAADPDAPAQVAALPGGQSREASDQDATGEGNPERGRDRAAPDMAANAAAQSGVGEVESRSAPPEQSVHSSAHQSFDPNTITAAGLAGGRSNVAHASPPSAAAPQADAMPPEVRFAEANSESIVRSMRAELLPNGGTMRIRLDPPQLGALQVTVQIRDGVITAAFETTSDEATRLLGHSLNHLKSVLESHGVGVDKLQVQQAPKDQNAENQQDPQQRGEQEGRQRHQDHAAQQEQQRREMMRKMWRRIAGGRDPLDLTA